MEVTSPQVGATMTAGASTASHGRSIGRLATGRLGRVPFLRTWESRRFRSIVAVVLVAVGLVMDGVSFRVLSTAQPESWAYDVTVYYHAAERIASGGSPYLPSELVGPVDALCPDCYLYPPPLAQALTPLTMVSTEAATLIWLAFQVLVMFAAVWLASGLGGARRGTERVIWCLAAVVWYIPAFASMWFGNVSTLLALCVTLVAMGGLAAGIGAAVCGFLKVAPVTVIPATLVMGRRARLSCVISVVVIFGVSFAAGPDAWLQYPASAGQHDQRVVGLRHQSRAGDRGGAPRVRSLGRNARACRDVRHQRVLRGRKRVGGPEGRYRPVVRTSGDDRHAVDPRDALVSLPRRASPVRGDGVARRGTHRPSRTPRLGGSGVLRRRIAGDRPRRSDVARRHRGIRTPTEGSRHRSDALHGPGPIPRSAPAPLSRPPGRSSR